MESNLPYKILNAVNKPTYSMFDVKGLFVIDPKVQYLLCFRRDLVYLEQTLSKSNAN